MKLQHVSSFGAQVHDGGTRFRLWAPSAGRVDLALPSGLVPMQSMDGGWYEAQVAEAGHGTRYRYRIDDEVEVPDPASRFNPEGVDGPSEVIDPRRFEWRRADWRGRPWRDAVLYELHIGTFTPEGTFTAAAQRLPELAEMGITALEIMPVAAFPGVRGWGYDGVLPYAVHCAYGSGDDFKRLVESAHAHGIMVLLDVVYNHFGPQGNYLHRYAKQFFTDRHHTPWGDAIDFSQEAVRQFFIQNALYWIEEFHLDGLRLDAVHAMYDDRSPHFIEELIQQVQDGPGRQRHVHLVLENHNNEAHLLGHPARSDAPLKNCVGQWNDDFHHPLHVILTDETDGYYQDFAEQPLHMLGRVLAEGFAFQGEKSRDSGNQPRGEPSAHLPPGVFVNFLQNHDQIGNRAFGERLAALAEPDPLRAAYAVLLLAPQPPMLFMGEEYAADQPFLYFCDYQGELAQAITSGRRKEFAQFRIFADEKVRERIPDPNDRRTFLASQLDWSERDTTHRPWRDYVAELLRVRREHVLPLVDSLHEGATFHVADGVLTVEWPVEGGCLVMAANLSPTASALRLARTQLLFTTSTLPIAQDGHLSAWEVRLLKRSDV